MLGVLLRADFGDFVDEFLRNFFLFFVDMGEFRDTLASGGLPLLLPVDFRLDDMLERRRFLLFTPRVPVLLRRTNISSSMVR